MDPVNMNCIQLLLRTWSAERPTAGPIACSSCVRSCQFAGQSPSLLCITLWLLDGVQLGMLFLVSLMLLLLLLLPAPVLLPMGLPALSCTPLTSWQLP